MSDISKITVNGTTYDIKDARLPAYTNTQATFLRDDGTWSTAGGDSPIVSGTGTGSARLTGASNTASGGYSTAVGYGNMASDWYSYAEGRQNISDGQASHAEGAYTIAAGNFSHSEGRGNDPFTIRARSISDNNLTVYSINGVSVGMYVSLGSDFSKITAVDTANDIVTLSDASWVPLYTDLNVMNTSAVGLCSHSEGYHTHANGDYSHAEGSSSSAIGHQSHAEGSITQAIGANSHSEGEATVANGESQHVQGKYNIEDTNGTYAHIVGNGTGSARSNAHTLDWSGNAWYAGTVSAGTVDSPATVTNANDLATKAYVDANAGGDSPVESGTGNGSVQTKAWTVTQSGIDTTYTQTASQTGAVALGISTTASEEAAFAEGSGNTASGYASHAAGQGTTASGSQSHSEGFQTQATAVNAHSEGAQTRATGSCSHAEGLGTIARGQNQHVEGKYNIEDTSSTYAHIIGVGTSDTARRNGFTVDWNGNCNVGNTLHYSSSLTGGPAASATGDYSSAIGSNATASGECSHASGQSVTASGQYSNAEGFYTTASGNCAHSEGSETVASGQYSHAEGNGTVAQGRYQHVEGQYNIIDTNNQYVHIVGGGSSDEDRYNIHTLDGNGNAWFNGSITVHDNTGDVTLTAAQLRSLLALL